MLNRIILLLLLLPAVTTSAGNVSLCESVCVYVCVYVFLCVIMAKCSLGDRFIAGTNTEVILRIFPGVYMSICLSVDTFWSVR